jgi:hypothetical protein
VNTAGPRPVPVKAKHLATPVAKLEACDACGYWVSDPELLRNAKLDGVSWPLYVSASHIADAAYEIVITTDLNLYLCGHHYRKHEPFIAAKGYNVRELVKKS